MENKLSEKELYGNSIEKWNSILDSFIDLEIKSSSRCSFCHDSNNQYVSCRINHSICDACTIIKHDTKYNRVVKSMLETKRYIRSLISALERPRLTTPK